MNKDELAEHYFWLADDAEAKGLKQKADEYREIAEAVHMRDLIEQYGHTPFDITRAIEYKPRFTNVSRAWPPLFKDDNETVVHALWVWLTDEFNWMAGCSPGFTEFFQRIWENIQIVFLWYLSPWFQSRYRFMMTFVNLSDCKLLDYGINWASVRNRQQDVVYYTLKLYGFHYTLTKMQVLEDGKEGGQNAFLLGIIVGLSDMTDKECGTKKAKIREVKTKVCSGWLFGLKSLAREFNKIVKLTPDLEWVKS